MTAIIIGGGISGLLLALALKTRLGVTSKVYEQAKSFEDETGGAIGMYANGLSVIRDISPDLLARLRKAGRPYLYRRWMRHDGSEVAVAKESKLLVSENEEQELGSIGIRRWKVQKAMYECCIEAGVDVVFSKRVERVNISIDAVEIVFTDGTVDSAKFVFGCDGVKSATRNSLFGLSDPDYTGMTCLMGVAPIPSQKPGIRFPSSATTKCHCCFYPTGDAETIFQMYFPEEEKPETWKVLSDEEGKAECLKLARRFQEDGWDNQFIEPLEKATNVIRVGLRARNPIPRWRDAYNRVILLGDAAHPPVPYIGQGAMMAIEDVGILIYLLEKLSNGLEIQNMSSVLDFYEKLRIPRTTEMLASSNALGKMQLDRARQSEEEVKLKEDKIKEDVAEHGTLPIMWKGSRYNYRKTVDDAILQVPKKY